MVGLPAVLSHDQSLINHGPHGDTPSAWCHLMGHMGDTPSAWRHLMACQVDHTHAEWLACGLTVVTP